MDAVLFDFDGTIADTLKLVVQISKEIAHRDDYDIPKRFRNASIEDIRNISKKELLQALPFSMIKVPYYVKQLRDEMLQRTDEIPIFEGMPSVIETLASKYRLGVLTSNSKQVAQTILKQHDLQQNFTAIHGGVSLFSKAGKITNLIDEVDTQPRQTIYIGDSTSDIDACHQANVPIISVTWGYDTQELLHEHEPTHLVDAPEDIITTIRQQE